MQKSTNIQIAPAQDAKRRRNALIESTYLGLLSRGMLKTAAANETARIVGVGISTVYSVINSPANN